MLSRDETRAAERAAGVSQSERFALELEFVMSMANPRYIHRACPGHTNQPPRESMFSTLNVESSSDPPIFHASSAPRLTFHSKSLPNLADLASIGVLEDPAFVKYLEYLRYWEQPQYAKFVHYPHAFYFLEQLRRPEFRKAMQNPRLAEAAHGHQFWHWQKSRTEQVEAAAAAAAAGGTPAPSETAAKAGS